MYYICRLLLQEHVSVWSVWAEHMSCVFVDIFHESGGRVK